MARTVGQIIKKKWPSTLQQASARPLPLRHTRDMASPANKILFFLVAVSLWACLSPQVSCSRFPSGSAGSSGPPQRTSAAWAKLREKFDKFSSDSDSGAGNDDEQQEPNETGQGGSSAWDTVYPLKDPWDSSAMQQITSLDDHSRAGSQWDFNRRGATSKHTSIEPPRIDGSRVGRRLMEEGIRLAHQGQLESARTKLSKAIAAAPMVKHEPGCM